MHIIYKTTYLPTNKIYIGKHKVKNIKTLDPWYVGSGCKISKLIQKDKDKFGAEWIRLYKREVLVKINNDDLEKVGKIEIYFIRKFDATNPDIGYNLIEEVSILDLHEFTDEIKDKISKTLKKRYKENPECHSMLGRHHSEISKRKISEYQRQNPSFKGRCHTKETKEKLREIKLGSHATEYTKLRVSQTHKGIKKSSETKQRMSLSSLGRKCITNGVKNAWLHSGEDMPEGWRYGRMSYRVKRVIDKSKRKPDKNYKPSFGKMWITNGLENLYIPKTDNIPQGYYKGLTRGLKK